MMRHAVFVYGTLLRGEANHHLMGGAEYLGPHRTAPCFALYLLGAYPGAVRGGRTAIVGEVFSVDGAGLRRLDRLEDYPRLYDRHWLRSPYGRAWIYLYRGSVRDRELIPGGDWRRFAADPDSLRAAGVRRARDPKTRRRRRIGASAAAGARARLLTDPGPGEIATPPGHRASCREAVA